jgi:hypothetical protein
LEKQEVQSLLPQREQVVILAASFTFFPHWLHFGTSPPPFPFLPPKKGLAGPPGFEPGLQAPQACVLSRLDHGPSLSLPAEGY